MVYDWERHEQTCYRLYIDEKKSLQEIMDYMRVEHKFTPSKRAFQTQFRRWKFPSKQNPAHKNDRLVERVRELWEKNLCQKEMLRILNEEDGFDIKQRELMRVRARNRWLLRTPNPGKVSNVSGATRELAVESTNFDDPQERPELQNDKPSPSGRPTSHLVGAGKAGSSLSPQVIAKRRDRLQKLEAQSAQRWEVRKRRRRTRGWADLPAGASGPPRFPSETTIDESRTILSLEMDTYRDLRTRFARICDDDGLSKKTVAGSERWERAKERLIRESTHLQTVIWMNGDNADNKKLALDVICTDVTKRMRTMENKMTIAEAKNALGINPEESRMVRQEFLAVLTEDHFISKIEAGQGHWEELKTKWLTTSAILRKILSTTPGDAENAEKLRATEVLARDVMKRLRDDQSKRDPNRKRSAPRPTPSSAGQSFPRNNDTVITVPPLTDDNQPLPMNSFQNPPPQLSRYHHVPANIVHNAPSDGIAPDEQGESDSSQLRGHGQLQSPSRGMHHHNHQPLRSGLPSNEILAHSPSHNQPPILATSVLNSSMPIDPQIHGALPVLLNSHSAPINGAHAHTTYLTQDLSPNLPQAQAHAYVQAHFQAPPTTRPPVAVYLRLHPSSTFTMAPSIWISTLTNRTFEELRQVAVKDLAGTMCGRVEGILGEGMTIEISRDDELTAYLAVVEGRGGAGTQGAPGFFVQVLAAGWKT
ncbi:hypothetical protein BX600DRAFT_505740 [Xylariales sp. PMI_506]|nr:hypothetical protein BX600DRAFT_505740 [Xylariales sp. PMI_506]